ncbi:MAG: hypothetical protein ABW173_12805 [Sphingomonas sp.]
MRRAIAVIACLLAGAAAAQETSLSGEPPPDILVVARPPDILVVGKRPNDPCYIARQVFVSPVGEPYRAAPADPAPVGLWFAAADTNRDGRIDAAEIRADAARVFALYDINGDGEIDPAEMTAYEMKTVPEVSIFNRTAMDRAKVDAARKRRKPIPYGSPVGAARFALLNIPHPLASGDQDYNRGITRAELEAVAAKAFAQLAAGQPALTLAALPDTPQAVWKRECDAKKKGRRRPDRPEKPAR